MANSDSFLKRLRTRLLPPVPDFYAMLEQQCAVISKGAQMLVDYMESGAEEKAAAVAALEHEGDRVKARNLDTLQRAFATPMDREDIYNAVSTIDDILNYSKTTVREMQELGVPPDEHTREMARELLQGAQALQRGFSSLKAAPEEADTAADAARKSERHTEKIYRRALAQLFDPGHYLATAGDKQQQDAASLEVLLGGLKASDSGTVATALGFVFEILKRREIYRHLSNAADRVARAGEVLHDIIAKGS